MSRIIQQIATVQFQVDNRKVTASMNALQTEAESLNGKIAAVNQSIKALGDVPADNKFLLEYQKQLRQLNSDLKDVTAAQRDLMKGVKAADQLWKAAQTQNIESLSIKAIKAGQNGLRKRMENLRPELGGDDAKMYDAYRAVIEEADRVMNVFKSNYATVVQTIRDGGVVSEQAMKSTRDALRDLMESEKEGTAEHRQLAQQYDFLNESLANVAEMRRREKGEIVNANDARREALKLTEDGIAAARRERDMADAVIAGMQQQKSDLEQQRKLHEDRIAQTEREIAANQRLEEAEQDRLADVEKAMRYTENEDRKEAIRLRKKADAARDEAEAKKEAYEEQAEQEKLLRQRVKDTGDEVTNLTAKIEALGKTEAKPKVDVEGVKKDIAALKAEYEKLTSDWMAAGKMQNPHQMYDTYEEFAKNVNHHGILKDLTYFDEDYNKYLDEMRKRKSEMKRQLVGDEILQSPAYRDREKIAKSGYGMNDPRLMEMNEEYFFGAKEAKDIIEGEKAYDAACERVANAIRDAHKKLREAFESGIQPEQVEGVAKQIQRLQSLYLGITDLGSANRESMMGSGKDIVKNIFGGDFDKEIAKIEAQIKRVMTLAEKNKYDYYDEHFGKEREDSLVKQQAIEKRQGEIKAELAQKEKIVTEAQQQSTTATNDQTEAIKKQEEELGKLEQKLKRLNESRDGYQNDVKESLKAVKDMGLTEEDLADDAKVREAVEKKVLEIMEAQAKVGQEIAEQRKKLAGEVKMSDLGGTKADQEFYKKHAGNYDTDQYGSPDDVIERIAHLERLKKIKNGKRFNPDEDWDDDDDLDEDAPIMSDKEKQAINDELRFLKQHIREELLKTIHEVGDINKAVEQYTGGDGVSEDAKFGEQLNDKIGEIKDKIEERIETTLDRYGEMLTEDRDEDAKLTKEQLTSHVSQHMKAVKENHGFNRSWLEETQGDIETTKGEIETKKQLIEQMKQQAQATKESTQADQQSVDVAKQKKELEGQLADATMNHTKAQKDFEAQQEKTNKAQEKAYKAQEESVALNEKAATAEEKVAHQEEEHAKAMDQQSERLRQIRAEGQRLLDQYEQQKTEIQAVDKAWADADVKQGEAEARKAQNQELTIKSLDDSIRKLKEANAVIDTNSDEWEENTRIIQRLQAALDEMKNKPALMMMTDRMQDVSKLSTAAVTETRKFWEAMVAGAERGSKELAEYEGHLKTITEEEQKRNRAALEQSAGRLGRTDLGSLSANELRQSIEDAKRLQATYKDTSREAQALAQMIVKAEEYAKTHGVEAVRAANKEKEAIRQREQQEQQLAVQMRQRLMERKTLSADALAETKKYWLAQKNGAEEGTIAFRRAEAALKMLDNVESERNKERQGQLADRLNSLSLKNYSTAEIKEAIEAAKQLVASYKSGSHEATDLTNKIIAAEEHLEKYSIEAARKTKKQNDELQEQQQTLLKSQADGFANASMDQLDEAIKRLKAYQTQIKDPNGWGKGKFDAVGVEIEKLTAQLNALKGVTEKTNGAFASADEVLARFSEHMGGMKVETATQQTEKLAQTLDEKLNAATSEFDDQIKETLDLIKENEEYLKDAEKDLAEMEAELERLEKKHANSSWLRKKTSAYKREASEIEALRKGIEGEEVPDEINGGTYNNGQRAWIEYLKGKGSEYQEWLDHHKQQKAEALGLNEAEEQLVQTEEKLQQTRRMTKEEMQEGIKILEEEAMAQDRSTADGQKKWEELRKVIDQMNQELKESTGEWMTLADAMKLAEQAEQNVYLNKDGNGFTASPQDMQKATQALERQRDVILQTIKAKRDSKQATDAEEKELADLTSKLKALKFEQDNFNMSQEKMQMLMRTPTNAVSLDELRSAIKRADGELKRMEGSLGKNNKEYKEFSEQVRNAKNMLKEMEGQAKASATAWEKAWSRLKTYVVMYMGFNAMWNKFTGTADDLMELSDRMGEVQKTTQMSAEAVGELSINLAKLDVRTPLQELMSISASAGQLGLKTVEDIQGFTEAANKLMIALPEMGKEAATEMMRVAIATGEVDKIRKQMQEGLIDGSSATAVAMEKIASTIDRLRASSASTAPEITDFVKRLGAVGAQSGISIDQVAALGSTISSLGMRVEMSATALSRMIPAIKNNAFAIANAIGVAPEALRSLFEAGRGMEAILMIFQHLKDQNANADSIEKLLGIGGMQDVMKQLNQQGARAGIVFAGLSQNVDELRKQLVTANEAYEENVAITNEFNRMNDTTAAKWERFKNQIQEMFVSDWMQRIFGGLIDGLRWVLDLLVGKGGLSPAIYTIITLFTILKLKIGAVVWGALATALIKIVDLFKNWRIALDLLIIRMKEMTAAQFANVFIAIAAAVGMLIYKLQQLSERTSVVANEMAKANEEILKQTGAVDQLFRSVAKTNVELENDRKRLDEVKKSAEDTTDAENQLKKANTDHAASIREINSKYGQYLGYMLSETTSTDQLTRARELLNAKLRETITLKQKEAALASVEQEYGGKVNKKGSSMERTLEHFYGNDYDTAARVSLAISEAAQKYAKESEEYQKAVKKILSDNKIQADVAESYMSRFEEYREAIEDYQKQEEIVNRRFEATANVNRKETRKAVNNDLNAILYDWKDLVGQYQKAEGEEKEKLAAEVYKQQRSYANAVANNAEYFEGDKRMAVYEQNIKNMKTYEKGLRDVAGEAIRTIDAMERAETKVTGTDFTNEGNSGNNPWGGSHEAASTDWKNMTANQLVERRKQMKDFVNAIQTDTDVQSVLKEDAALKKAIENGMSSDMRTVIEWYNTERLKIQDELHARHLTNTGDWMDPKKTRARKKMLHDETKAYLDEIDAYYTERKAKIQEAANEEGITEAEVRNRTLANEAEWRQRRMELQKLYGDKAVEVSQEEQDAIAAIIAERTDDDEKVVKAMIQKTVQFVKQIGAMGEQGAKEAREFWAKMDKQAMQDFNKEQAAIHQQMKAIQDIIDKERPFNGITKNLRENLVTMGILTADMTGERDRLMKEGADMADFNARQAAEELKRTTFMLGEAEHAYTTTIEEIMKRMADAGMTAWADEVRKSPKMQEGLLAQLHQTYDAIQEAIKKEASLMKKQAENMWNSILLPGGDGKTTIKDAFEKAISQLGIDQGRVSRANSLIGAGAASERVADKLAIKQMQLQLTMQQHYYNLMRKQGMQRIQMLERQTEELEKQGELEEAKRVRQDKEHVEMSLRLAMTKEQTELLKQQEDIIARTEESQNRLYTELKEWGDLFVSSIQSVMEASNAGNAEYYNERAKLDLTGKGGPGAGTYVVIDNEGTSDAKAHYEYLDERQALERQHEIEVENARAEAWKKVMDDINQKLSDTITDQLNALFQNAALDVNTQAIDVNTDAITGLTGAVNNLSGTITAKAAQDAAYRQGGNGQTINGGNMGMDENGVPNALKIPEATEGTPGYGAPWMQPAPTGTEQPSPMAPPPVDVESYTSPWAAYAQANSDATKTVMENDKKAVKSSKQSFAAMTAAANMYGVAYQAMSNENLSTSQKVWMMIVQAAGQAMISMLTASLAADTGETASHAPAWISKTLKELGPVGGPVAVGVLTALIGGLMATAVSKTGKSKSQIAQVTGASASAGKLATGMLTYAEGNVNEFSDPKSLTPGRSYNVDAADGRTYRARYMGKDAKTHITSGPEFHLVGEKGREAIIDAKTTRNIQMNDPEIWGYIQTLYNGGRMTAQRRYAGRWMRAFADGNLEEFDGANGTNGTNGVNGTPGITPEMVASMQASMDRQNELLERALAEGIKGVFGIYGKDGLVHTYDSAKKTLNRHGERY